MKSKIKNWITTNQNDSKGHIVMLDQDLQFLILTKKIWFLQFIFPKSVICCKNNSLHLPCYPIVVRLPDTTYTADSSLDKEVLSKIWHAFLGDHKVWFDSDHFIAYLLDIFLLHLQNLAAKLQPKGTILQTL